MLLQDVDDVDGSPESLLVAMGAPFFQRFVLYCQRARCEIIMKLENSCCLDVVLKTDPGHWMPFGFRLERHTFDKLDGRSYKDHLCQIISQSGQRFLVRC